MAPSPTQSQSAVPQASGPTALSRMRLGPEETDQNPLMIQFFTWDALRDDMSWWQHLEQELPELSRMGFTQVWIPPPNKAAAKTGRGYDAYDLWDLGEFDQKGSVNTRWGSREELLRACETSKRVKVDVIIDAVLNHKLGGDRVETFPAVPVDPQNRLRDAGKVRDIEGWTAFDFPGRGGKASIRSRYALSESLEGVDWDHKTKQKAIYRIAGKGHRGWSRNVDAENGNYDYLLGVDIDHRHPEVQEDLLHWGDWILKTTGAAGFRLDAVKHMDYKFVLQFISSTRRNAGDPRLFCVSEYWTGNVKSILPYIRAFKGETAFFDVPLHMHLCEASRRRERYDLRDILSGTLARLRPGDAVTFVDNHDTVEGMDLESWVEENFKIQAYALILLRPEGYPCVFYGDLYPNAKCYNANTAANLRRLIEARRMYAYGPVQDYNTSKNCVGFVRGGTARRPGCVVLLSNRDESGPLHTIRMNVGPAKAGTVYRSYMTQGGEVQIDAQGWGEFSCFANAVQVWVPAG
ncbi:glycoside hydrolase superfamily [Schizophyllum amplum]|uniref:Glycoside hydrolase superfamily n=1 Tax=Schizophyllum amplum TaxID=97359 RepID=A0A550CIS1_9AGAR|nr:glycoside hydrolase superfamily [Auriculariopsis ampla]